MNTHSCSTANYAPGLWSTPSIQASDGPLQAPGCGRSAPTTPQDGQGRCSPETDYQHYACIPACTTPNLVQGLRQQAMRPGTDSSTTSGNNPGRRGCVREGRQCRATSMSASAYRSGSVQEEEEEHVLRNRVLRNVYNGSR